MELIDGFQYVACQLAINLNLIMYSFWDRRVRFETVVMLSLMSERRLWVVTVNPLS